MQSLQFSINNKINKENNPWSRWANTYILTAIIVPANTSNPLSLCTLNFRWDWWTEGVGPSSAPTVNEQDASNLHVSSPLVWHQKGDIILAETVLSLQHDPGITWMKESSRKSAKFNSQTGQVDFLIRSLFYAVFTQQNAPSRLRSHPGCPSNTSATSKHSCKTQEHFPFHLLRTQHKECP